MHVIIKYFRHRKRFRFRENDFDPVTVVISNGYCVEVTLQYWGRNNDYKAVVLTKKLKQNFAHLPTGYSNIITTAYDKALVPCISSA